MVGGINPMMPPPLVQPPGMMPPMPPMGMPPMPPMGGTMGDKGMMVPPAIYGRPPTDLPPHFPKPPMGGMQAPQTSVKFRVGSILRDKQRFLDMDEQSAKRGMIDTLRLWVEELGIANGQ